MKKLFAAIAALGATTAFANDHAHLKVEERPKSYLGIEAGRMWADSTDAPIGRIYGGTNLAKDLSGELGIFRTADFTETGRVNGVYYEAKGYVQGIDAAIKYHPEVLNGLYFKGGVAHSEVHATVRTRYGSGSGKSSGISPLVGVGFTAAVAKNVDVGLGFTHYHKVGGNEGPNANVFTVGIAGRF